MSDQRVTVERQGSVLLMGLNRPEKLNAADLQMLQELSLAYAELEKDPSLRVGLLFAHGDHFTAGLDLVDVAPRLSSEGLAMTPEGGVDPWGIQTDPVSKPVVMAIQGTCFTLGVELALNSEIVIASDDAVFAQLEVSRGILPFGGATKRLPRVAGWSNAMRYLLTGESFDAEEALRIGVVSEVVSKSELQPRALEIANQVAAQAPLAVQATLASARAAIADEAEEDANLGRRLAKLAASKDAQAAMAAFLSKTSVEFKGE
ncbi:MAG: crotonase/enoyl-CoA hydratase family protein [Actinomycetota bacterium]